MTIRTARTNWIRNAAATTRSSDRGDMRQFPCTTFLFFQSSFEVVCQNDSPYLSFRAASPHALFVFTVRPFASLCMKENRIRKTQHVITHLSMALSVSPNLPGPASIIYWISASIPVNHGIRRGTSSSCEIIPERR